MSHTPQKKAPGQCQHSSSWHRRQQFYRLNDYVQELVQLELVYCPLMQKYAHDQDNFIICQRKSEPGHNVSFTSLYIIHQLIQNMPTKDTVLMKCTSPQVPELNSEIKGHPPLLYIIFHMKGP